MNWKQITPHMWIRDDGVMLELDPNIHKGMKRQTWFWLLSVFNTKVKVHLTTTFSAKERDDLLKFILEDKRIITFFGEGDWQRGMADLNRGRKNYYDFEEPHRGSYYGIEYVKYEG